MLMVTAHMGTYLLVTTITWFLPVDPSCPAYPQLRILGILIRPYFCGHLLMEKDSSSYAVHISLHEAWPREAEMMIREFRNGRKC